MENNVSIFIFTSFFFSPSQKPLFLPHFLKVFFFFFKDFILQTRLIHYNILEDLRYPGISLNLQSVIILCLRFFWGNAETKHFHFILTNNFMCSNCRSWAISACLEHHCLWGILCYKFHSHGRFCLWSVPQSLWEFCLIPHAQNEELSALSRASSTVFPLETFCPLTDEL